MNIEALQRCGGGDCECKLLLFSKLWMREPSKTAAIRIASMFAVDVCWTSEMMHVCTCGVTTWCGWFTVFEATDPFHPRPSSFSHSRISKTRRGTTLALRRNVHKYLPCSYKHKVLQMFVHVCAVCPAMPNWRVNDDAEISPWISIQTGKH